FRQRFSIRARSVDLCSRDRMGSPGPVPCGACSNRRAASISALAANAVAPLDSSWLSSATTPGRLSSPSFLLPRDLPLGERGPRAADLHVDTVRRAAGEGAIESRADFIGPLNSFAAASKCLHHAIVAGPLKLARDRVRAALQFALEAPTGI